MTAAEILIEGGDCFMSPCLDGGQVILEESLSFTSFGDLIIDGSAADGDCGALPRGEQARLQPTGHSLPRLVGMDSSQTVIGGALSLIGAASVHFDSSMPVQVGGDFDNRSVRPDCFDWTGGSLIMGVGAVHRGGAPNLFEVASADVGVVDSLGNEQVEFAIGAITVSSGADVAFVDAFDNDSNGQPPCSEALYVGALTLEPGATITVVNCRIYHGALTADPEAITTVGCGELIELDLGPSAPDPLAGESPAVQKVRHISFVVPATSAGTDTALRVQLTSLHHPSSPPPGTPDFAAFEGGFRYLNSFGGSTTCVDNATFATNYRCGTLGCQPEYRDWATALASATNPASDPGLIHVTGDTVVPSSTLTVTHIGASCGAAPGANTCSVTSSPLAIPTSRWGDVGGGGGGPSDNAANVIDIGLVVDNVKGLVTAIPERRAWMKSPPNTVANPVNVIDIGLTVDAVKGLPYPYTITSCP